MTYRSPAEGAPSTQTPAAARPSLYPVALFGVLLGMLSSIAGSCASDAFHNAQRRQEPKNQPDGGRTRVLSHLQQVDLAPCRTAKAEDGKPGPVGPGRARMMIGQDHVTELELVDDDAGFTARYAETATGACVLGRLAAARVGKTSVTQRVVFDFFVPPEQGRGFDGPTAKAALAAVDLSACKVERANLELELSTDGSVDVLVVTFASSFAGPATNEGFMAARTAGQRCLERAYRDARVPSFVGTPVHTMWRLP